MSEQVRPVDPNILVEPQCIFQAIDVHTMPKTWLIRVPSRTGTWHINPVNDAENRFSVEINSYTINIRNLSERCSFQTPAQKRQVQATIRRIEKATTTALRRTRIAEEDAPVVRISASLFTTIILSAQVAPEPPVSIHFDA